MIEYVIKCASGKAPCGAFVANLSMSVQGHHKENKKDEPKSSSCFILVTLLTENPNYVFLPRKPCQCNAQQW